MSPSFEGVLKSVLVGSWGRAFPSKLHVSNLPIEPTQESLRLAYQSSMPQIGQRQLRQPFGLSCLSLFQLPKHFLDYWHLLTVQGTWFSSSFSRGLPWNPPVDSLFCHPLFYTLEAGTLEAPQSHFLLAHWRLFFSVSGEVRNFLYITMVFGSQCARIFMPLRCRDRSLAWNLLVSWNFQQVCAIHTKICL